MTLGFPASATVRLAASALFCAAAALMVRAALDGPRPIPPRQSPTTQSALAFDLRIESTAPVTGWRVTADGAEVPPEHADERSWSARIACAEDAEIFLRADPQTPGPRALRIRAARERILWGEGPVAERLDARTLRGQP